MERNFFNNFTIYPNPFQHEIKIQFSLYQDEKMKIQIFNSIGNLIENICNRSLEAGNQEFTWKPNNIPSGTYFIRFETQNQTWIEKLIYLP